MLYVYQSETNLKEWNVINMKKLLLSFLFIFSLLFQINAQVPVDAVTKALQSGNATEVAKQFDKVVDITINNEQATYSKSQAEMVLKNFFSANAVSSFSPKHKGSPSDNNSVYLIGDLTTKDSKKFRIYLYFKKKSGSLLLQELRFEE